MKGTILGVDVASGRGQISGDDGKRYPFLVSEVQAGALAAAGSKVDFEIGSRGEARGIFVEVVYASSSKNRIVAAILAFFFGGLGVHKFYLGKSGAGLVMLLLTVLGIFLSFIFIGVPLLFIVGIIAFIEALIYLFKSDEEFDRLYVQGDKAWF